MTYATVMVSLALDQSNEARLQVAGELAERIRGGHYRGRRRAVRAAALFHHGAEAQSLIDQEEASIRSALPIWSAIPRRHQGARRPRGVARRNGFSDPFRAGGGTMRRHHRQRRPQPGLLRCVRAREPQGPGDAGRPARFSSFPTRSTGSTCAACWWRGRTRRRRGARWPMRCRCCARRGTSPSSKSRSATTTVRR